MVGHCRCLALLALFAVASPSSAQDPNGVEMFANLVFQDLGHATKLQPIDKLTELYLLDPEETLLIVLGDNRILEDLDLRLFSLRFFLDQGGALLVATDRPDEGRLKAFGLSVNGQSVRQSKESSYQGFSACPFLGRGSQFDHPLLGGKRNGLATNNPSFLRGTKTDLRLLIPFPRDCYVAQEEERRLRPGEAYVWCSAAQAPPGGRSVFIAGHGIFLNGMLGQELAKFDNDNRDFLERCLNWLGEGPRGRRKYALLAVNGEIMAGYAFPLDLPPAQPQIPSGGVEAAINEMLDVIQKEGILDRMLIKSVGRERLVLGILVAVTSLCGLWAGWRLLRRRHWLDTGVPLLIGLQDHPALQPLLVQRHQALSQAKSFWEPAQVLIRQWFLDHAGVNTPLWDAPAGVPPTIADADSASAKQLQRLWQWVTTPPQGKLASRQFLDLMGELELLTTAVHQGRLRFLEPASGVSA